MSDLCWWLFKKKQEQSEQLPPIPDVLHQATLRTHHQLMVWNNDAVANSEPSPDGYGWKCPKNRCCCRTAGLNCTDLCSCSRSDDDGCENMEDEPEGVVCDCDDDLDEIYIDYFDYDDDDGHVK